MKKKQLLNKYGYKKLIYKEEVSVIENACELVFKDKISIHKFREIVSAIIEETVNKAKTKNE